jgi:hypothetical protein
VQVLAGARERERALPLAHVLEQRAAGGGPGMGRRLAHRVEQRAAMRADQRAEGHRRVRHAERRRAHFGQRAAQRPCDDAERRHVGGLALVGRHAGRGIALDVLDRLEALAQRNADVLRRHVVLEIHECAPMPRTVFRWQYAHRRKAHPRLVIAARRADAAQAVDVAVGHERVDRRVEAQLAARLGMQVHCGRPPAVHGYQVAVDGF